MARAGRCPGPILVPKRYFLRDYELVVVLAPSVGDEGFPVTIERINGVIQTNGGEIKNVDAWGRRRLAYPIRRNLDGYYAVTQFTAEPTAIRPLEANLDLAEDVLRHLVIKVEYVKPYEKKKKKDKPGAPAVASAPSEASAPVAPAAAAPVAVAEPEAPEAAVDDEAPAEGA
ncbi:MAG: 30S ribosomal protein S6 [Chloroflexota bacterium]